MSEIALNPDVLGTLRQRDVAATLVHELTHLWQHAFGARKSRAGYHNVEWSEKMDSIGLVPSDTGKRAGVRVGQTMSQYVRRGGAFETAFSAMPREWLLPFLCGVGKGPKRKHDASKSKFVCSCGDAAWGKPSLGIRCLKCRTRFLLEHADEKETRHDRRTRMDSQLLTDWTAMSGSSSVSSITQPAAQWLDLPDHEDAVFFLEVKELSGTVTMIYESSPTCQDQLFVPVIPAFTMATGPKVDRALFSTGGFPLCRFLRWRLTGSNGASSWGSTFRIWVALYSYGVDDGL